MQVTDVQGQVYTAATLVQVFDPITLDAQLQAVWQGVKDAVRAGDLGRAGGFLHSGARAAYQDQFSRLSPATLANIDQIMTSIKLVDVGFGGAQYEMLRGGLSFAVWFQIDPTPAIVRLRKWSRATPGQRRGPHGISEFIPDERHVELIKLVDAERRRMGLRPVRTLSGGPE